jgi:predicted HD phosphohydrolase
MHHLSSGATSCEFRQQPMRKEMFAVRQLDDIALSIVATQ